MRLAGTLNMRHSHATHDLVNAIAEEDYPSWTLEVQTMDPVAEESLDFDPLDCTKVSLLPPCLDVCICYVLNS